MHVLVVAVPQHPEFCYSGQKQYSRAVLNKDHLLEEHESRPLQIISATSIRMLPTMVVTAFPVTAARTDMPTFASYLESSPEAPHSHTVWLLVWEYSISPALFAPSCGFLSPYNFLAALIQ